MKSYNRIFAFRTFTLLIIAGIFCIPTLTNGQVKYRSEDLAISIKGTSSLHDWEIKSDKGEMEAVFVLGPNYRITGISGLKFSVDSKSLKSGQGMMDKNTYKALRTSKYSSIDFSLTSATINQIDANNYQLKCIGNLSISGTSKQTELIASCKLNADKTFTCSGSKKLKMTDFNINPPTAMLGTIKTGDEISIAYSLKVVK